MLQGARNRTAMTLVELMVVMAIIVLFTAITAAFYPANQADRELSRFSSTVQSALLSARNRAKAERLPTGIRFYADLNSPTKVGSVVLIQKPAPLDGAIAGNVSVNLNTFVLGFPAAYQSAINTGDFMVLESGDVATIASYSTVSNPSSGFYQNLNAYGSKYKIFRGSIELSGDTPFELSNIIDILNNGTAGSLTSAPISLAVSGAADIIFNPDGSLNNYPKDIYLHLHNFESLAGEYSRDAILAVRKMSGSIGVYEVGPTGAPYQFAFDPRNKGI